MSLLRTFITTLILGALIGLFFWDGARLERERIAMITELTLLPPESSTFQSITVDQPDEETVVIEAGENGGFGITSPGQPLTPISRCLIR